MWEWPLKAATPYNNSRNQKQTTIHKNTTKVEYINLHATQAKCHTLDRPAEADIRDIKNTLDTNAQ